MNQADIMTVKSSEQNDIQAQLQEEYFKSFESLEEGQLIEGTVVQIAGGEVFVDIGYKSEGKIPETEFSELPEIGKTVSVLFVSKEDKNGGIVISKRGADIKQAWITLKQTFQKAEPAEGKICRQMRGGYDIELGQNIHAFLPISQVGGQRNEAPESLIGQTALFLIDHIYSDNRTNIVVSRRKYLERLVEKKREEFFATVDVGATVKGTIKDFMSFGAFVDLGGFDGLLHISDMSWEHVIRPKDFINKGEEVELKVIRLDPAKRRINLSLKHLTEDPWLHFEELFYVGYVATGTVTKLTEFGAFIELSFGIEGLAHVSELSWTKKIGNPSDMLKIGDKVEYKVLGYDIQAGRVSLSLRQAMENPWDTVSERYPVNMRLTRPVTKVIKAGAFIQLEEGIDAFLHIDDYSWTKKIRHPGSELSVGQEVETVIIENNPKNRRIRLSIKHLTENPWQLFASAHPSGSAFEGEIASITGFGLFVRASEGIEGLVNRADLVEKNENFAEAVRQYKVGDKINVLVLETNIEKQQSAFSVRKLKEKQKRDEIAQYMTSKHDEKDNAFTLGDLLKIKTN